MLADKTLEISESADAKAEAKRQFENARSAQWFKVVVDALRAMAGSGGNCMWCSSNESSHVEHYRPKSTFPQLSMAWENYLWACSICNSTYKKDQFPDGAEQLINPVDEPVWDFFYIDDVGLLTARFDVATGALDRRALSTLQVVKLGRDDVAARRRSQMKQLKTSAADTLARAQSGQIDKVEVLQRMSDWRQNALQPDVSSFFLDGPGKNESPFRELFEWLNA